MTITHFNNNGIDYIRIEDNSICLVTTKLNEVEYMDEYNKAKSHYENLKLNPIKQKSKVDSLESEIIKIKDFLKIV